MSPEDPRLTCLQESAHGTGMTTIADAPLRLAASAGLMIGGLAFNADGYQCWIRLRGNTSDDGVACEPRRQIGWMEMRWMQRELVQQLRTDCCR